MEKQPKRRRYGFKRNYQNLASIITIVGVIFLGAMWLMITYNYDKVRISFLEEYNDWGVNLVDGKYYISGNSVMAEGESLEKAILNYKKK